jgi:hypothetical protein
MPPHMAISELMATSPLTDCTDCALITLKPNQPMHRSQEPIASHGIDEGGMPAARPFSKRPSRGPSLCTAAKASQPPTACTTTDPAKSWNSAPSQALKTPSCSP